MILVQTAIERGLAAEFWLTGDGTRAHVLDATGATACGTEIGQLKLAIGTDPVCEWCLASLLPNPEILAEAGMPAWVGWVGGHVTDAEYADDMARRVTRAML